VLSVRRGSHHPTRCSCELPHDHPEYKLTSQYQLRLYDAFCDGRSPGNSHDRRRKVATALALYARLACGQASSLTIRLTNGSALVPASHRRRQATRAAAAQPPEGRQSLHVPGIAYSQATLEAISRWFRRPPDTVQRVTGAAHHGIADATSATAGGSR